MAAGYWRRMVLAKVDKDAIKNNTVIRACGTVAAELLAKMVFVKVDKTALTYSAHVQCSDQCL